jgi:hypothetical protein
MSLVPFGRTTNTEPMGRSCQGKKGLPASLYLMLPRQHTVQGGDK